MWTNWKFRYPPRAYFIKDNDGDGILVMGCCRESVECVISYVGDIPHDAILNDLFLSDVMNDAYVGFDWSEDETKGTSMPKYISRGEWFDKGTEVKLIDDYRGWNGLEAGLFEGFREGKSCQEVCGFDEFDILEY